MKKSGLLSFFFFVTLVGLSSCSSSGGISVYYDEIPSTKCVLAGQWSFVQQDDIRTCYSLTLSNPSAYNVYLDNIQVRDPSGHESQASVGIYLPRQGVSFAQDVIFSSNLLSQNTSELAITYRGTISQGESFTSFSFGTPLCKLQDYSILGSPYTAIFKVSNFDISMPDSSSTYRIYRYFLFQGVSRAVCSDTVSLDYFGFTYTNVKASLSDYVYEKTTMVAEDPNESGRHIDNGDGDFFGRSITSVGLVALILFVPSATFGLGLLLGWVIFHQRRKKS